MSDETLAARVEHLEESIRLLWSSFGTHSALWSHFDEWRRKDIDGALVKRVESMEKGFIALARIRREHTSRMEALEKKFDALSLHLSAIENRTQGLQRYGEPAKLVPGTVVPFVEYESLKKRSDELEAMKAEMAEIEKRIRSLENKTQGMPVIYSNPSPVADREARLAELEERNTKLERIFDTFTHQSPVSSLEEMLADKARLDWLESQSLLRFFDVHTGNDARASRAALDAARREEKSA